MNPTEKAIIEHAIDGIQDIIDWETSKGTPVDNGVVPSDELHDRIYNQDYFVIGSYEAEHLLMDYGVFAAIGEIVEYEKDNFGEVTTEITDPEKVMNMLAYMRGEIALHNAEDNIAEVDSYSINDLLKIQANLEAQL